MNSLDKQINWGLKTAFFRKKTDRSRDVKTKHKIMSFENQLIYSSVNYLIRILKKQNASFHQEHAFPNLCIDLNKRTLKLSYGSTLKSSFMYRSFSASVTRWWNCLSLENRTTLLNRKQHQQILRKLLIEKEDIENNNNMKNENDHWKLCKLKP